MAEGRELEPQAIATEEGSSSRDWLTPDSLQQMIRDTVAEALQSATSQAASASSCPAGASGSSISAAGEY